MEKDLFKYLPSDIITNILLRLPPQTIASSKCVCKPWLDLLETDEFVKFHFSRSSAALAVMMPERYSSRCTIFEFDDEIDLESSHDRRYNHLTKFNFPHEVAVKGSANGMLFLRKRGFSFDDLYICNPISREYIELRYPDEIFSHSRRGTVVYGFGVSKISGQHKVVRIIPESDCHVYTLGTGSWRRVEAPSVGYGSTTSGAFVNGNLHWLVSDLDDDDTAWISCFDLETECFTAFSVPEGIECTEEVSALSDCLCLCDHTSEDEMEIVIWLMKEYGDEKSWAKDVINLNPDFDRIGYEFVYPVKVFEDGDILMIWDQLLLFYYSNKTKTSREIGVFNNAGSYLIPVLLTPSFLSLKSFGMESVISL